MEDVRHTKGLLACEQAITEASARCSLCFLHSQFATIKNQEPVGVNDPWIPCRKPAQGNTEHQEASGDFLPQIKIRGCVSTAFIPILNSELFHTGGVFIFKPSQRVYLCCFSTTSIIRLNYRFAVLLRGSRFNISKKFLCQAADDGRRYAFILIFMHRSSHVVYSSKE